MLKPSLNAVQDVVRAHADDIEDKRRLPDAVVEVIRGSGLNRLAIPAALGGRQAPVREMVKSVEAVAMVDGSAGWCAAIGASSNVFAGYLPEPGARHVFADPDQGSATMFAPTGTVDVKGRGGRLTGRWPFTSNCLHSAWAGLGATVRRDGEAEPLPRVVFVPLAELTVEDTWNAPGLRGTGSHHVSAGDVVVDLDHSCRFSDRAWPDGTLWRLPIYTVLSPVLAAVPIGIARGALDEVFVWPARVGSSQGLCSISRTVSSSCRGRIPNFGKPDRSGDATVSTRMSSTWFRVMGGFGKISAAIASTCQAASGTGIRMGLRPASHATQPRSSR